MSNTRTKNGLIDDEQRDLISIMLDGSMSLADAAEIAGIAITTARRWWREEHAVRREFERQKRALGLVFDSLTETLTDARATAWLKSEARTQLLKLMLLDDEGSK